MKVIFEEEKVIKKPGSHFKRAGHIAEEVWAKHINGKILSGSKKTDVEKDNLFFSVKKGKNIQLLMQVLPNLFRRFGNNDMIEFFKCRQSKCDDNKTLNMALNFQNWLENNNNFYDLLRYVLTNDGEVNYLVDMIDTDNQLAFVSKTDDLINYLCEIKKDIVTHGASLIVKFKNKSLMTFEWRGSKKCCFI